MGMEGGVKKNSRGVEDPTLLQEQDSCSHCPYQADLNTDHFPPIWQRNKDLQKKSLQLQ